MRELLFFAAAIGLVLGDNLPPSCIKPVYCDSDLLHYVQLAQLYNDSKTFVDFQLRDDENNTLAAFDVLLNETNRNPTKEQLQSFVDEYFESTVEIEEWTPPDFTDDPSFLATIRDEQLRQFAKDINAIWPVLGRKVKSIVFDDPEKFSLIPVTNGFIVPGGRFRELYYWDTYWIIEGLLICDMDETAKGVIDNLIQLLKKLGHIPNGSRWYYQERSQPPLLTKMMAAYINKTSDFKFLEERIYYLEEELEYWLKGQAIEFDKNNRTYTLLRYYAPSRGPRPESYYEDYTSASFFDDEQRKTEFYIDIKSAAESGWDFSSRWFVDGEGGNSGNLTNIRTSILIPVDQNAIFADALQKVADFHGRLHHVRKAAHWAYMAKQWRKAIEDVLWDQKDGIWYDYDMENGEHRRYFYPSNFAPLWLGAVEPSVAKAHAPSVVKYVKSSHGIDFPGGVPASLDDTGEQWDFPNAWPPLVSIVVNALKNLDNPEGEKLSFHVAETWVRACYTGFNMSHQMYEKYDAESPGRFGGGGEYTVQSGFGWSNGVVLEFLNMYGTVMTANDSNNLDSNDTKCKEPSQSEQSSSANGPDWSKILIALCIGSMIIQRSNQ